MASNKKFNIEQSVLKLLESKSEINFNDVVEASGLSKTNQADRRAIGRSFVARCKIRPSEFETWKKLQ